MSFELSDVLYALSKMNPLHALLMFGGAAALVHLVNRSKESFLIALTASLYAAPLLLRLMR